MDPNYSVIRDCTVLLKLTQCLTVQNQMKSRGLKLTLFREVRHKLVKTICNAFCCMLVNKAYFSWHSIFPNLFSAFILIIYLSFKTEQCRS